MPEKGKKKLGKTAKGKIHQGKIHGETYGYGKNTPNGLVPVKADNPMNMYGAPKMQGQPHMESNKQQKSNLMNDNPVAKHASNSWLSKHMK